ncbi:hypothetical protein B0H65DRAFT_78062 [Neurospora tetraspora]|uniref:Uncharacterized protein n=1 Tax=Neurospora tetraspora TaxID=94610 RepID=A0AAE0J0I5_9PEZI|nr:hypothetical protein B0H65DRAFT_78062 [Neurospora tetraspora]
MNNGCRCIFRSSRVREASRNKANNDPGPDFRDLLQEPDMRMALFNFVLADMADKVLKKLRREDLSHHCTRHLAYCDSFSVGLKCSLTLHNNGHSQAAPGKRRKFEKIASLLLNITVSFDALAVRVMPESQSSPFPRVLQEDSSQQQDDKCVRHPYGPPTRLERAKRHGRHLTSPRPIITTHHTKDRKPIPNSHPDTSGVVSPFFSRTVASNVTC